MGSLAPRAAAALWPSWQRPLPPSPPSKVACGRGLELIYEFLISDETRPSPDGKPFKKLVRAQGGGRGAARGGRTRGQRPPRFGQAASGRRAASCSGRCLLQRQCCAAH